MPDGYKNGAFALGIVVGGGIALNLFLWLDYQQRTNQQPNTNSNPGGSEVGNYWDGMLRAFVSPSDTLAQWIMAIFTIAVVVLVWRTLLATQIMAAQTRVMARDTARIGAAQVRPYIAVVPQVVTNFAPGMEPKVHFEVRNTGNSPAFQLTGKYKFALKYGDEKGFKVHFRTIGDDSVSEISAKSSDKSDLDLGGILTEEMVSDIWSGRAFFFFAAIVCYDTVFKRHHRTIARAFSDPTCIEGERVRFYPSSKNNRSN